MKALRLSSMFSPYESNYIDREFSLSVLPTFVPELSKTLPLARLSVPAGHFFGVALFGRRRKTISGDDRVRTGDPRLAKAVLCQLSYIPTRSVNQPGLAIGLRPTTAAQTAAKVVGHSGFEPETSRLSSVRSNQLS